MNLFVFHIEKTTLIVGGLNSSGPVYSVEYFGPLNITIPPLRGALTIMTAAYLNGILYGCGGSGTSGAACFKYDLAADSGSWENLTTIPFRIPASDAVAFDDFFWYFTDHIMQVPVNGSSVTSYDWSLDNFGCAVGNGSHTVIIQRYNSSVLINNDPSSPMNWTTAVELNTAIGYCGCLWLGNTIYVTGGFSQNGLTNLTQLINTDTFEVTLGVELPIPLSGHKMGVIDGRPAVIGADINGFYSSAIYVYDSCTNTWSLSEQSLPAGLKFFASVTF